MRRITLAIAIAAIPLAAHAGDYCTPLGDWQHTQPGQTITLDCGDETVTRYPVFAPPGYGGHPGPAPFVIGWDDTEAHWSPVPDVDPVTLSKRLGGP